MKKILITAFALTLAVPALAAQQDIAQLSAVTASREALRTAINTQLSAVQSNFDEIYPIIEAGPVYVNASAPADTKVVWVDTDQDNAIKVNISGTWTVVGTIGGAGDNLGSAAYTDVVALWTTCTGYLKSDGTCDTPSGSATYPSAAGVANWNGSAWGTSYTVGGDAVNELVQTQSDGEGGLQLPFAIDLADITDTTGILTAKSDASCFASESAFNACFALDWPTATGEGYTNLTEFVGQTAWRLFYSNGSGDVTELTLGSSGTVLKSNGTSAAPTWEADATAEGAGYVSTPPTYSDETCTAGQYALTESYRYDCVASGNWNRTALTDWSNPTPVTYSLDLTISGATGADKMTGNGVDYTASTNITGLNDSTYELVGVPDTGRAVVCTGDVTGTTPNYSVDMSSADKAVTCTFSASLAVNDDFSANTIADYTNIAQTMSISGGAAHGTDWETTIAYHETPTGSNDHWVSGSCTAGASDNACLILGSNGTGYYFAEIANGSLYIKSNDANWSTTYNGSYVNGTVYTVVIQVNTDGSSHAQFNAWVGGTQVITNASDTSDNVTRGQYVGVRVKRTAGNTDVTVDNLQGSSGAYTP